MYCHVLYYSIVRDTMLCHILFRLPDWVGTNGGRRRSAATPPDELSRGKVGKMLQHVTKHIKM